MGPSARALAAEIGDGVIFTAGSSVHYVRRAIKEIKEYMNSIGRATSDFDIAALVITSVSNESIKAKDVVKPILAPMISRPKRAKAMLDKSKLNVLPFEKMRQAVEESDLEKIARYIPSNIVDELAAAGVVEECVERLRQYISVGVTTLIILPVGPNTKDVIELIDKLK